MKCKNCLGFFSSWAKHCSNFRIIDHSKQGFFVIIMNKHEREGICIVKASITFEHINSCICLSQLQLSGSQSANWKLLKLVLTGPVNWLPRSCYVLPGERTVCEAHSHLSKPRAELIIKQQETSHGNRPWLLLVHNNSMPTSSIIALSLPWRK